MILNNPGYPKIPKDLLEYLDKTFPGRCPDHEWSDRRVWIEVGKRQVVEHLQALSDEMNDSEGESDVHVQP